ncbi:secretion protein [Flavobacterium agrisoli]|uniref:Secretion protein n=1 Tax=Flavobacterium agrisoli TaxID=2793066 RepID=A0A934UJ36_9FLAO|nr:secretion protein [Flavobacterium agrisoli]MBK0369063.1 secretion protein [Flavobacterium agrisoli]
MKTILKLLVLAVMFTGVNSYAIEGNEDFRLHVIKNEGKQISFSLNKVKAAKVSIYEKDGTLIYFEKIKGTEDGILRTFSLEEFPEGDYLIVVENENKKLTHEISVTDKNTTLSTTAISEVYKNNLDEKNTSVASR